MRMSSSELVEPTPEEARNGWTAQSLTLYIREIQRKEAEIYGAEHDGIVNPSRAESRYNPFRW